MPYSYKLKKSLQLLLGLGFFTISNASLAAINLGFEDPLSSGWSSLGDAGTKGSLGGVTPYDGAFLGFLTTAFDANDDSNSNLNKSGVTPVNSSQLESFLGLPVTSLDPDYANFVTATEGSAMKQSFAVLAGDVMNVRYNLISNDIASFAPGVGGTDSAYITINQGAGATATRLAYSSAASSPASVGYTGQTLFQSFQFTFANAGLVTLGFAVVDVGDFTTSSALLIDGITITSIPAPVPEPSQWAMLFIGLGITVVGASRRKKSLGIKAL